MFFFLLFYACHDDKTLDKCQLVKENMPADQVIRTGYLVKRSVPFRFSCCNFNYTYCWDSSVCNVLQGVKMSKRSLSSYEPVTKKAAVNGVDLFNLPENLLPSSIKQLVDEADQNNMHPTVSVSNVKRLVSQLELRIQRNEEMRLKYPDNPEKFLKSEVDLDEELTRVKNISSSAELLNAFLNANGFSLLIPLLEHENVDIAGTVLSALVDITSPDVDFDNEMQLLNILIKQGILSFFGELVYRLTDMEAADEEIVTSILQVLDHLLEIDPMSVSDSLLTQSPKFLSWMLRRLRGSNDPKDVVSTISYNRCYCAEMLSIILQHSEKSCSFLGDRSEFNAVEKLLRCFAQYRKTDPQCAEEDEFVANIANCLISLLGESSNQDTFGAVLGVDLMIRLLRDRKKVYPLALKITIDALREHRENSRIFIERFGLKSLFGIFMKRGVNCRPGSLDSRNEDEYCLNIILHLCRYTTKTPLARLLNKFMENQCEKLERLLELHLNYFHKAMEKKKFKSSLKELEELQQLKIDTEDATYLQRCEAGLFILQCVDHILLRLVNMGNTLVTERIHLLLNIKGIKVGDVEAVMKDYIHHLHSQNSEREEITKLLNFFFESSPSSTAR